MRVTSMENEDGTISLNVELPFDPGKITGVYVNGEKLNPPNLGMTRIEFLITPNDPPKISIDCIPL